MKKIYGIILFFMVIACQTVLKAQSPCDAVTVEVVPTNPQTGQYNYFGVRVSISQAHTEVITVVGTISEEGGGGPSSEFELTITAGQLTAETSTTFFQACPACGANASITSVTPCPGEITITYAGVSITYEVSNSILRFNSVANVGTVLNQLDDDYENHNENYESQYSSLTADQLDSMDVVTGFDEFKSFRDFENLFSGFSSKRAEIENTELTWLNNNFGGTDPDDIDLTFDDAENTIFNNNYSFKVGSDVYQLTSTGIYVNGTLLAYTNEILRNNDGSSQQPITIESEGRDIDEIFLDNYRNIGGPMAGNENIMKMTECKSNKKKKATVYFDNDTKRMDLKVAINSIVFKSSVKAKAVNFKKKNGNWRRSRTKMAVGCGGTAYNGDCSSSFQFTERKPDSGYKKRKSLKAVNRSQADVPGNDTIWKTFSGLIGGTVDAPDINVAGNLTLTF